MQTSSLIEVVQERTGNESDQVARDLLNAVLTTLAERDLGGAQSKFAAQLPEEFRDVLQDRDHPEPFDAEEFVRRVAERADITAAQSETWTRATLSGLVDSVTAGQRADFVEALPADFESYTIWAV